MSTRPNSQDGLWAWLGLIWTTSCGFMVGCISFGYGVVLPTLMVDMNENRERTALVGSLTFGVTVFSCVFFCRLCEKYPCRLITSFGVFLYALGLVTSSLVRSIYLLYISYSLCVGLGAGASFAGNFIHTRRYFKKWYSFAVGAIYAGAGVGMLSIGPIMQAMIDRFGWRNAYRILAGAFVLLLITAGVLDPNVEEEKEQPIQKDTQQPSSAIPRRIVLGVIDLSVWKFPEFTLCAIATSLGLFGHYTALILLGQYSEDLGNSPQKASVLYLYLGAASVVSRVITGKLCDFRSIKPRHVHQVGAVLSGVSTILLIFAKTYTHLVLFAVFYGIADGIYQTTIAILFTTTVDLPRVPLAFGQANMVNAIPSAAGAPIAGLIADKTGSYVGSFVMAGVSTVLGGLTLLLHICFFKDNLSGPYVDTVQLNCDQELKGPDETVNIDSNHSMAFIGPADTTDLEK